MYKHTHTHMCIHMYMCTHVHVHTCTCAHTHMHAHTCTHTFPSDYYLPYSSIPSNDNDTDSQSSHGASGKLTETPLSTEDAKEMN